MTKSPMMFQDKFNSIAKATELNESELTVAKFFWYAGLRHAFQRGTSVPSLLTDRNTGVKPSSTSVDVALTAKEAKQLSLLVGDTLHESTEAINGANRIIRELWNLCDKEDENTTKYFSFMNKGRTKVRTLEKQIRALEKTQRKLKKMSKGS